MSFSEYQAMFSDKAPAAGAITGAHTAFAVESASSQGAVLSTRGRKSIEALVDAFHEQAGGAGCVMKKGCDLTYRGHMSTNGQPRPTTSAYTVFSEENNDQGSGRLSERLAGEIRTMVHACGVPLDKQAEVAIEVATMLDNLYARQHSDFAAEPELTASKSEVVISPASMVGYENYSAFYRDTMTSRALLTGNTDALAGTALESFGVDSGKLLSDTRTSIVVILRRALSSLTRRVLPVIAHADPIIKVSKTHPEVWSLDDAASTDAATRQQFVPFLSFYHFPNQISAVNTSVKLNQNQDSKGVMYDATLLKTNQQAEYNLWELGVTAAGTAGATRDHTDLIDEGPKLASLMFEVAYTDNGTTVTDKFLVNLTPFRQLSEFKPGLVEQDEMDREIHTKFKFTFDKDTKTSDGSVSNVFSSAALAGTRMSVSVAIDARMSLRFGVGSTLANVRQVGLFDLTTGAAQGQTLTQLLTDGSLTVKPVAFGLDAKWRQENLRDTTTFGRVRQSTMAFVIPTGKAYAASSSIQQANPGTDQGLATMLSEMSTLGNDARGLATIQSHINGLRSRLSDNRLANDYVEFQKTIAYDYIAGNVVNPTNVALIVDLKSLATATLRETERKEDKYAAIERLVQSGLSHLMHQSLIGRNLNSGETMIFNCIMGRPVLELGFGVPLSRQAADTTGGRAAAGCDLVITMPSGTTLRIFATDYAEYTNKAILMPMRDQADSPLNMASLRDCGQFTHTYTNTKNNAVDNRAIMTSREHVLMQCPVSMQLQIRGLEHFENTTANEICWTDVRSSVPVMRLASGQSVIDANGTLQNWGEIVVDNNAVSG